MIRYAKAFCCLPIFLLYFFGLPQVCAQGQNIELKNNYDLIKIKSARLNSGRECKNVNISRIVVNKDEILLESQKGPLLSLSKAGSARGVAIKCRLSLDLWYSQGIIMQLSGARFEGKYSLAKGHKIHASLQYSMPKGRAGRKTEYEKRSTRGEPAKKGIFQPLILGNFFPTIACKGDPGTMKLNIDLGFSIQGKSSSNVRTEIEILGLKRRAFNTGAVFEYSVGLCPPSILGSRRCASSHSTGNGC